MLNVIVIIDTNTQCGFDSQTLVYRWAGRRSTYLLLRKHNDQCRRFPSTSIKKYWKYVFSIFFKWYTQKSYEKICVKFSTLCVNMILRVKPRILDKLTRNKYSDRFRLGRQPIVTNWDGREERLTVVRRPLFTHDDGEYDLDVCTMTT